MVGAAPTLQMGAGVLSDILSAFSVWIEKTEKPFWSSSSCVRTPVGYEWPDSILAKETEMNDILCMFHQVLHTFYATFACNNVQHVQPPGCSLPQTQPVRAEKRVPEEKCPLWFLIHICQYLCFGFGLAQFVLVFLAPFSRQWTADLTTHSDARCTYLSML